MTRLFHFTDVWFYSTAQREREVVEQKGGTRKENGEKPSRRARDISLHQVWLQDLCAWKCMQNTAAVSLCV